MKKTIFYSWQSDLPNSTNRSFIQSAINKSISDLKKASPSPLSVDFKVDMDTSNIPGTPDIAETILNKINKTSLFIADVSIVNPDSKYRKTPNPNVLIELGYAAKAIGWDRILCVFNDDYGSLNDLPFDLRHRRPLVYHLSGQDKGDVKKEISIKIQRTIQYLYQKGLLFNEIQDHLKKEIDTEILTAINWLSKILFGYCDSNNLMQRVGQFLNINNKDMESMLCDSEFIGFQVFKRFEVVEAKLKKLFDKIISSNYFQSDIAKAIVNIIDWLGCFDSYTGSRSTPDLFVQTPKISQEHYVLSGQELGHQGNKQYPYRYLLLQKLDNGQGKVLDFGDFENADKLLTIFKLNPKYQESYSKHIARYIKLVENWLDLTNGEFILDTYKHFEMRFTQSEK